MTAQQCHRLYALNRSSIELNKSSNYSSSRTMGDTKYLYGNGDADTRKMWTDYLADKDKQAGRGESRRQNNNVDGV